MLCSLVAVVVATVIVVVVIAEIAFDSLDFEWVFQRGLPVSGRRPDKLLAIVTPNEADSFTRKIRLLLVNNGAPVDRFEEPFPGV